MFSKSNAITIHERYSWDQYFNKIRTIKLLGDKSIQPYKNAEICSRIIKPTEVYPIAKYVLNKQINIQKKLAQYLKKEHQIDIFDLNDHQPMLEFSMQGEKNDWVMSPPIIEVSVLDDNKPVLVDGEHRFYVAKKKNIPIRVVWIEKVPAHLPVVARPLKWSDIKEYDQVPSTFKKRIYRYPTLDSFPDISDFSDVEITAENYLYFFYRDLSPICSSGIRKSS